MIRILLVDDNPNNLIALNAILRHPDYELINTTSGAEALTAARDHSLALVLADVMMPVMDGFELARRLKQDPLTHDVPIIFLTAMASEITDLFRGYEVGGVDYLQKPLDPEVVKAKVAVFVKLYRQQELIKQQAHDLLESQRREQAYVVAALKRKAALQDSRTREMLRQAEEARRTEALQAVQLEATQVLAEAPSLAQVGPRILKAIGVGLGWSNASLWLRDGSGATGELKQCASWGDPSATQRDLVADLISASAELGAARWEPEVTVGDRIADAMLLRTGRVATFPVVAGMDVIGVIAAHGAGQVYEEAAVTTLMVDLGARLGAFALRRQIEAVLRQSEEKIRLLVAGVKDCAIFMLDEGGHVTTWNSGAEHITGYTEREMLGQRIECLYPSGAVTAGVPAKQLRFAAENGHYESECEHVRKDGSLYWANVMITPLFDERGRLSAYAKVTRDVTSRKRIEDQLVQLNSSLEQRVELRTREMQAREAQLRALTNAVPMEIAQFDRDGALMFANDAFAEAFWGNALVRLTDLAQQGEQCVSPEDGAALAAGIREALAGRDAVFELSRNKAGRLLVRSVTALPERNELGQITGAILVASDITRHKGAEAALIQAKAAADAASAAKSAFLANMSHEIRTPLGAVLGYSELLLDPGVSHPERVAYQAAMKRNGALLSKIINDILDLSKVESGKLDVECKDASLDEVLADVLTILRLQASEKGVTLKVGASAGVPSIVRTDSLRLRQILINIVGNAIKFMKKGEVTVTITAELNERQHTLVNFLVADTGPGISGEVAARLFEPFAQADASTTRRYGGTGLGLVLSRRLANELGGDVTLHQSTVDQGSVFVITIDGGMRRPCADMKRDLDSLKPQPHVGSGRSVRLEGAKILLVDDAADNRVLVCRLLRLAGAEVETAENGQQAVDQVALRSFDVVLMDLQMPILDGYAATQQLRDGGYVKPIIALTAHALNEERDRCLRSGFNGHISKPIERNVLLNQVAAYLTRAGASTGHGEAQLSEVGKSLSDTGSAEGSKADVSGSA